MNKLINRLLLVLFPFFPIWAWLSMITTNTPFAKFANVLLMPIALYFVFKNGRKIPTYLVFLLLFTLYHLVSVFQNDLIPNNTTWYFYIFSDMNVFACTLLIIVENSQFNTRFIKTMNLNILFIVIISMIVSIIQIKNPTFFFYTNNEDGLLYSSVGGRCFSIYSWVDMNSQGITFPILISILLSVHKRDKLILSLTGIIGIIVAFLTRARYVMISILITFIQILYSKKTNYSKKGLYIVYFVTVVFALGIVAENFGFNYQKVIDERILEKGTDMHSASVRVLSYYVFVAKFPEHPYFGVGPKTGDDVIKLLEGKAPLIHVGYLSYLYFYGIVGASLLFLALFYLVWDAWRIGKKSDFWGSFYGLLGFCFANTTFVYFNLSEMGIVLSVIYLRYYEKKAFLDIAVKQLLLNNKNMSVNIKVN